MIPSFLVTAILWILFKLVELIYIPVHFVRLLKKPKKCPPISNEILLLPVSALTEKIRRQEISCEEVIKAYISRVREVNPIINAVIDERFEDALSDARKVDDFIRNANLTEEDIKSRYPLLGVPLTVKGSIAAKGLHHTGGLVARSKTKPEKDAIAVKYAREAGAIPILTSNVPELCLNWETRNKLVGTTKNPHDDTKTSGGSSGGEASLMGSGASLIGIGSDIAGSLRLPAHYCGVWGHKPSPLVVSCEGHYPDCRNRTEWNELFTLGPMSRYAKDLKILLRVIAEPRMREVLMLCKEVRLEQLKIYYIKDVNDPLINKVERPALQAIDNVIKHFNNICEQPCTEVQIPLMKYCSQVSYLNLLYLDKVDNLFNDEGDGCYSELLRFLTCKSESEISSILYGILRRNAGLSPKGTRTRIKRILTRLKEHFRTLLGDNAVFICPSYPSTAPYHGDVHRKLFNYGYLSIFNALGLPATNCPVSFAENGLPVGLQVIAGANCDRLTLAVAEEIERAFGGWRFDTFTERTT